MHRKAGEFAIEREQGEVVDRDAGRFDRHLFAGASELIGGYAVDLFCRKNGRHLVQFAAKTHAERAQLVERKAERLRSGGGLAVGVEAVRAPAEADGAGVVLVRGPEELREAGVLAKQQREHASSHGVERAEVADGALAGGAAHEVDDVVRGYAGGFVEDEKTIHGVSGAPPATGTRCGFASGF